MLFLLQASLQQLGDGQLTTDAGTGSSNPPVIISDSSEPPVTASADDGAVCAALRDKSGCGEEKGAQVINTSNQSGVKVTFSLYQYLDTYNM